MKWDLNVQGELVVAKTGRKPREERRQAIRDRLFALSDEGHLPDMVLTKALEVSNLSYAETRQGAAAAYDTLLDRLLDDDLRIGRFLDDWLKVPPDEAPASEPEPPPPPPKEEVRKPEPETGIEVEDDGDDDYVPRVRDDVGLLWKFLVYPYPATQENLDRNPYYRLFHRADVRRRKLARQGRAVPRYSGTGMRRADVIRLIVWLVAGFPFIMLMATFYEESDITYLASGGSSYGDDRSGGFTGAIIWAVLGVILWRRGRQRLSAFPKFLYGAGIAACIILAFAILNIA
jgi:hypothetical protein